LGRFRDLYYGRFEVVHFERICSGGLLEGGRFEVQRSRAYIKNFGYLKPIKFATKHLRHKLPFTLFSTTYIKTLYYYWCNGNWSLQY